VRPTEFANRASFGNLFPGVGINLSRKRHVTTWVNMVLDKKRKLRRTVRLKIEGKNGRPMCCRITHQYHLIEEDKKIVENSKKKIIIATAIVMGT